MLSPSHLAYVNVIKTLIDSGRSFDEQMVQNHMISLSLLTWLDESIPTSNIIQVKQYTSLKSFYDSINRSMLSLECTCKAIDKSISYFNNINSVDELIDFIDSTRNLFEYDSSSSYNSVPAPTKLCYDSNLGIFLRSIHACWDSMSFGGICLLHDSLKKFTVNNDNDYQFVSNNMDGSVDPEDAFRNFAYKLGIDDVVVDIVDSEDLIDDGNAYSHLLNAMKALVCGDVKTAEGSMHWYFDYNSSDPLTVVPSSNGNSLPGKTPTEASRLLKSCNQPQFANERHQQAMLTLASMWARNSHYSMALLALEEAMKTAHQKGDHISIAKALLVLHEVVLSSQKDQMISDSNILPEEVLCRCINRCVELHMRPLAAQAAIFLAKLRAQRPLRNNGIGIFSSPKTVVTAVNKSKPGLDDNTIQSVMDDEAFVTAFSGTDTIQNVWYLLLSAEIGECHLISQVANGTMYNASSSIHPNTKDSLSQDIPLSVEESIAFSIQVTIISSDLWNRLGLMEMALLQCKRAMRQYGLHACSEDFINICCKMARNIVDIEYSLLQNNFTSALEKSKSNTQKLLHSCNFSLELLKHLQKLFPARYPSFLSSAINFSITYVAIHQEISKQSWDSALILVLRLVEISTSRTRATESSSFVCSSPEMAQANILLANILEHIDIMEAYGVLLQFESLHDNSGLCQFKFEAAVLKSLLSIKLYDARPLGDIIILLRKMVIISRIQNFPTVEMLAKRCINTLLHK